MVIKPKRRHLKQILTIGLVLFIVCSFVLAVVVSNRSAAPPNPHKTGQKKVMSTALSANDTKQSTTFNKSQYSTTDPSSIWVVVNKQHPLSPIDYAPSDLTTANGGTVSKKIAPSLSALVADAKAGGTSLHIISGYRSYSYQVNLYNSYVASDGQAKADTYSARPGYSEHQTGLAVDLGGAQIDLPDLGLAHLAGQRGVARAAQK